MIFEAVLLATFVVAGVAFVVKLYEWRRDVLYGPYIDSSE
jgi:hypothetical protein